MALSKKDIRQIEAHGISEEQVTYQLKQIEKGFPLLKLESAASIDKGIIAPKQEEQDKYGVLGIEIRKK